MGTGLLRRPYCGVVAAGRAPRGFVGKSAKPEWPDHALSRLGCHLGERTRVTAKYDIP